MRPSCLPISGQYECPGKVGRQVYKISGPVDLSSEAFFERPAHTSESACFDACADDVQCFTAVYGSGERCLHQALGDRVSRLMVRLPPSSIIYKVFRSPTSAREDMRAKRKRRAQRSQMKTKKVNMNMKRSATTTMTVPNRRRAQRSCTAIIIAR